MRWHGGSARLVINAVVIVAAFVGGVVAWAVIGGSATPSRRDPAAAVNDPTAFTIPFGEQPAPSETGQSPAPASDGGAPSATEAVERFLEAEAAGRFDESFLLLSTADRTAYRSAAYWTQAHSTLPPIVGHELTSTETVVDADRVELATALSLEPALDEVAGLVPGRAEATWTVVRESELWRVSLADSVLTATWPDEDEAPATVRAWAAGARDCDDTAAGDLVWAGGLIGTASLATDLCGRDGRLRLGPVALLDPIDAGPFTAAFGEDIVDVARVVPVVSPVELQAVVAPLGDEWLVVGALPPPP
jgi:hypothetical protein